MSEFLSKQAERPEIPFDHAYLDGLMDDAGLDAILFTSRHNVQYVTGHRPHIFEHNIADGISRYLPIVVYPKGRPEAAAYIGSQLEGNELAVRQFWMPDVSWGAWGTLDAMQMAIDRLRAIGLVPHGRIGVETAFLPFDAGSMLAAAFDPGHVHDALFVGERLRALKRPEELAALRTASELVVQSMLAVVAASRPGITKHELVEALSREETSRGLIFEYCLIAAGQSFNRAPTEQRWEAGEVLSLDSGGTYGGYIGDLTRMAVLGSPDAELVDLLSEVETIQQAAIARVGPGVTGDEIYEVGNRVLNGSPNRLHLEFMAHGIGLIPHEAPRIMKNEPRRYPAVDAPRPLEAGMVLSVETTLKHPRRGFIKLEDTVAVTGSGFEVYGNQGRGWNRP